MTINDILLKLLNISWIKRTINLLRRIVLPGFDGVPLFDSLVYFVKGLIKGELSIRAAALSYNFFMALFPLILFLITIIGYLPISQHFINSVYDILHDTLPENVSLAVQNTIEGIMQKNATLLSFSIIFTFYFATRGVRAMMSCFNATYHEIETRSAIKLHLVCLWVLFILVMMFFVIVIVNIAATQIFKYLLAHQILHPGFLMVGLRITKWLLIVFLVFLSISTIYYFAPAKKREFRFFSAGSSLATLLIVISSAGFNFYISNFSNYNAVYGSIGTLIIFLVGIQLISMIIIIGFELNASIHHARIRIDNINKKAAFTPIEKNNN